MLTGLPLFWQAAIFTSLAMGAVAGTLLASLAIVPLARLAAQRLAPQN